MFHCVSGGQGENTRGVKVERSNSYAGNFVSFFGVFVDIYGDALLFSTALFRDFTPSTTPKTHRRYMCRPRPMGGVVGLFRPLTGRSVGGGI